MTETTTQGRGRLTPERTQEVYESVVTLLIDAGYEGLTMDAVAHAASCSKATLYRRWGGKETLVIDALEAQRPHQELDRVDTGSLRGDLHEWARLAANAPEKNVQVIQAVMHACTVSADLRDALRDRIVSRDDNDFRCLFTRAVERGEIDSDVTALAYLPAIFVGSFLVRHLLENSKPDEAYLIGLIDSVVLPALGIN